MGREKKASKAVLAAVMMTMACAVSAGQELHVANWNDYIDPALIGRFENESGIKVHYQTYETGEEMDALLQSSGPLDVVVPSSDRLPKLISDSLIRPFDASKIDGFYDIQPLIRSNLFTKDQTLSYAAPYFWGRVGVLLDRSKAEAALGHPITPSWGLLFNVAAVEKLSACGVSILEGRDEIYALIMNYKGRSLDFPTERSLDALDKQLSALKPHYAMVDSADYREAMAAGKLCVSMAWEGDARAMVGQHPGLEYILPDEGTLLFLDAMAIPAKSQNYESARKFISFFMRSDVAQQNAEYTLYNTPNAKALEAMKAKAVGTPGQNLLWENGVQVFTYKPPRLELERQLRDSWSRFSDQPANLANLPSTAAGQPEI